MRNIQILVFKNLESNATLGDSTTNLDPPYFPEYVLRQITFSTILTTTCNNFIDSFDRLQTFNWITAVRLEASGTQTQ